jgi:hypothetical protein
MYNGGCESSVDGKRSRGGHVGQIVYENGGDIRDVISVGKLIKRSHITTL